jgi:hypothetical protein
MFLLLCFLFLAQSYRAFARKARLFAAAGVMPVMLIF